MKEYKRVQWERLPSRATSIQDAQEIIGEELTPVCLEVGPTYEQLPSFDHMENALYVFGPEDGTLDRGITTACHRFVTVPSRSCMNLGAAVNVTLYDRCTKLGFPT